MTAPKRAHFSTAFGTDRKVATSSDGETNTPPEKGKSTSQQKSRINKVQIPMYVSPEVRKQLKILSAETERTQDDLLKEAINDLFRKHNKPMIA